MPGSAGRRMLALTTVDCSTNTPWWYTDRKEAGMAEIIYTVSEMSCGHCEAAVRSELLDVAGVEFVGVDLETKLVTVRGADLDDAALRAAIEEAGYVAA
jgi:copper chaperone CopZ